MAVAMGAVPMAAGGTPSAAGRARPVGRSRGLRTQGSGARRLCCRLVAPGRGRRLTCEARQLEENGGPPPPPPVTDGRPLVPGQTVETCVLQCGNSTITLEAGEIGRQANGAVMAHAGKTTVYTTACADYVQSGDGSFLPLQVQYMERFSATGRTSGGYIKRDGRQKDNEVLTSRLVDRPLRPMFEAGWATETQVLQWVLSFDGVNSPEPLAITAAGAALAISDIPLSKPVAGVKVGLIDGEYVVNPSIEQMQSSLLDLTIAGTEDAVLMIEGFCKFLTEEQMLESVRVGAEAISGMCKQMKEWADKIGKPKIQDRVLLPDGLAEKVEEMALGELSEACRISKKQDRGATTEAIRAKVVQHFSEDPTGPMHPPVMVSMAFKGACSKALRTMVLEEKVRTDGRGFKEVRPIASRADVLPCTHGSALFTRGETQALCVTTLGNDKSAQKQDSMQSEFADDNGNKSFYLQYFFPPSSVSETGRFGAPGRREVGHGQLAERALAPIVPDLEEFNYTIRVESTITESNGSSSMASICGGCLSMMDAGVPVKDMVAGVAMGLIMEEDGTFVVLTDILGSEDALGDMDFKVAGSKDGVTAFQMDIKVEGITLDIMAKALEQAKEGRMEVLSRMNECSPAPSGKLPDGAPRNKKIMIDADKVSKLIGSKGATVKGVTEDSGVHNISIDQDGSVVISAPDEETLLKAEELIRLSIADVEVGTIYRNCKVVSCVAFGCFVEFLPGKQGLVHISQLAEDRVGETTDVVNNGDFIDVKCLEVLSNGKVSLSRKAVLIEDAA